RHAVSNRLLDRFAEQVYLVECGIDIRRDPNSPALFLADGRHVYSITVPQICSKLSVVDPVHPEVRQSAGLRRIIGRQYSNALNLLQPSRPAILQKAQPRSLALNANPVVKG